MYKCQDCKEHMEVDPLDYEIDDMLYCEHCGATHLVTAIDDQELGVKYELVQEEK